MTDIVTFLNVPAPWVDVAPKSQSADECEDGIAQWGKPISELFETVGDSLGALRKLGIIAPREGRVKLSVRSIEEIDVSISGAQQPVHLIVASDLHLNWEHTLKISDCRDVVLDFGFVARPTEIGDQPIIQVSNCERIQIRGLLVNELHERSILIENSSDIAVIGSAFSGFSVGAIEVTNSQRVLIDRCSFSTSGGCAVEVVGDVRGLGVLRSQFNVSDELIAVPADPFIRLSGKHVADGYSETSLAGNGDPARDMLTFRPPIQVLLVENRFFAKGTVAVCSTGVVGLWIEASDFFDFTHQAIICRKDSVGVMIAGNRLRTAEGQLAGPCVIEISDTNLFTIFSNTIETLDRSAVGVLGRFGGGLIACNSFFYIGSAECDCDAVQVHPKGGSSFGSLTFILNVVRGRPRRGIHISGHIGQLYFFDNHLFAPWEWSIESDVVQPRVSSLNNFSPVRSRNVKLSDTFIKVPRAVFGQEGVPDRNEVSSGSIASDGVIPFGRAV